MRLVFAGTPEPALASLRRLIESPSHDVIAVLTRPDAASGRRGKPQPSPVAREAAERGIPVLRPSRPNSAEFVAELSDLAPECCAVVAYGALLGGPLLAVPPHGWVNLHFSLLPAWRGAAPVQAAIAAGDTITGATTFQIEPSLDSGPIYGVVTEVIQPTDTAGDLLKRLAVSGAALLSTTLDGIADQRLTPRPQPADGVSVAPKITVANARVRWDLPAASWSGGSAPSLPTPAPGRSSVTYGSNLDRCTSTPLTGHRSPCRPVESTWNARACGSAPARNRCGWARFSRPARNS